MLLQFRVNLAASFRAGLNCQIEQPVRIDIDPTKLSQEERDLIAERLNDKCEVLSRPTRCEKDYDRNNRSRFLNQLVKANAPTAEAIVAAIREEDTTWEQSVAEYLELREQEIHEYCDAALDSLLARSNSWNERIGNENPWFARNHRVYYADWRVAAKYEEANAEAERRNQAMRDALEAKLATKKQATDEWIATYGSSDLRRMVAEDMQWADLYSAEREAWDLGVAEGRLVAQRPGWIVANPDEISQPIKPRARAWAILDAARLVEPSAKLGRLNGKYVAYAEFEGQTIVWPAD